MAIIHPSLNADLWDICVKIYIICFMHHVVNISILLHNLLILSIMDVYWFICLYVCLTVSLSYRHRSGRVTASA